MAKNEEKTIPFLRRLLQMMKDNEHAMSFVTGDAKKNIAGRFVIHDRALVEAEILPKYFNHASFASLRRQLNYFHFVREGKGRMKGATYYNDAVFVIDDILKLRRRNEPVGATNTEKKVKAKVEQVESSESVENEGTESAPEASSAASSRRKRKKAPSSSEPTEVKVSSNEGKEDTPAATLDNSNAHIISPSESMEDMSTKGEENDFSAEENYDEEVSVEGSLASYKSIQTNNQNKKPTIVLDLTRPSESDFTTPFYAHGYASFSQLQQQQQYCNEVSYVQPLHHYQHDINHEAVTFAATTTASFAESSDQGSPHPITPPCQGDTTWEDEMLGCSALLALQNCGPPPDKKPRQEVSA